MNTLKSVLAGAAVLTFGTMTGSSAADARSYVAGNFFLELGGSKSGFIKSVEGGAISAEVINEAQGASLQPGKHLSVPIYEPFSFHVGLAQSKPMLDWISETFDAEYPRKDGVIIAADYKLDEKSRREFFDALITEVTIPACDGASKDPAYLTVKVQPEMTRKAKGAGKVSAALDSKAQKLWLPSNFKLEIAGIDCTKVQKIESFTIKQSVVKDTIGSDRDYLKEPGKIEYPDLRVTVAASSAQDFINWHDNFVIKGNNGQSDEKSGSLSFLSLDRKEELAKVTFYNLGIFRVDESPAASGKENVATVVVDLYVERMEIDFLAQFEK